MPLYDFLLGGDILLLMPLHKVTDKLIASRPFRDYGEAVLKQVENLVASDPKLLKAPVNYEGVSSDLSA